MFHFTKVTFPSKVYNYQQAAVEELPPLYVYGFSTLLFADIVQIVYKWNYASSRWKSLFTTSSYFLKAAHSKLKVFYWIFFQTLISILELSVSNTSDGYNHVQSSMFNCSKPKIWCLCAIPKRLTRSSPFDVRKNDVWVCSMNTSVNLVEAF